MLRSSWFGRTFIAGEIEPPVLGLAIRQLRKAGQVLLDLGDHRSTDFPPGATGLEPRVEFYARSPDDGSVARLIASVPAGLDVRRVTQETFNRCTWQGQLHSIYGSASGYLERSVGLLLMDGEYTLSEAHAFFWGDTFVEIGVITADDHRGLGYASIVSANLVEVCEGRGYATYWGCHVDNLASAAVARKLGYRTENRYSLVWYPAAQGRGYGRRCLQFVPVRQSLLAWVPHALRTTSNRLCIKEHQESHPGVLWFLCQPRRKRVQHTPSVWQKP